MADLQITQLPELGSAQLQATDPIALADISFEVNGAPTGVVL